MGRHAALRYLRSDALPCESRHASTSAAASALDTTRGQIAASFSMSVRPTLPTRGSSSSCCAWPASKTMSDASLHTAA